MDVLWRDRGPARGGEQPPPGGARGAPGARRRRRSSPRRGALRSTAEVDVDLFELAAADARRVGTPRGLPCGARALRRRAAAREPLRRLGGGAARASSRRSPPSSREECRRARLGARRSGLPADASSFVGREPRAGRAAVAARAGRGCSRSPARAAAGKTRLALELARGAEPAYEAGAALVELAPLADAAPRPGRRRGRARRACARCAGAARRGDRASSRRAAAARSRQLRARLVASARARRTRCFARRRGSTIVATSREPLRVPGEVVFRVPSLEHPRPRAGSLPPTRLLRVRGRVASSSSAPPPRRRASRSTTTNADDVARICLRLDGLPLALELAAGRVGALSAGRDRGAARRPLPPPARGQPRRADAAADARGDAPVEPRPARARRAGPLPPARDLRRRLRARGGRGGLRGGRPSTATAIADVLARLVEKSLVTVEEAGEGRRYRLLETVRLYARERLDDAGETCRARGASRALGARPGRAGARLAAARPRGGEPARRASTPCSSGTRAQPCASASRCCPFWLRRIDLAEASRRFAAALAAAPERTTRRAEALLGRRGDRLPQRRALPGLRARRGEPATSPRDRRHRTRVAGAPVPRRVRGRKRRGRRRGALARARARARAPRALRGRGGDRRLLARRRRSGSSATCRARTGSSPRASSGSARSRARRTRFPRRSTSRRSGRASRTAVRPPARLRGHAAAAARDLLRQRRQLRAGESGGHRTRPWRWRPGARAARRERCRFRGCGRRPRPGDVLVRRAYISLAEGDQAAARGDLEAALELRARLSDRRGLGLILSGLGLIDTIAGDYAGAERHLAEARDMFRRAGDRWGLASTLWRIADLAFARGRLDDAEAALEEANSVLERDSARTLDRDDGREPRRGRPAPRRRRARVRPPCRRPRPLRRARRRARRRRHRRAASQPR